MKNKSSLKFRVRSLPGKLLLLMYLIFFLGNTVLAAEKSDPNSQAAPAKPTLEEIRINMEKWIQTQQIISKERKDWQQGKEILTSRLDLVKKEITTLEEKNKQAQSSIAKTNNEKSTLLAENDKLKAAADQLIKNIASIEDGIRQHFKQFPEPIKDKLQPLFQRIPEDPNTTKISIAERFQNVLGILNELNKANNEISVNYEVHNLANNKPSEVKVIYVGLAHAFYVSSDGQAGIGQPSEKGWQWEPSKNSAKDILNALEILQGKQSPAFVPLPVKIQ